MKHETKSRHSASGSPAATAAESAAAAVHVTADGTPIDFHSTEFNRVDDLNDWAGDCRSFEPLGDVVTADMRPPDGTPVQPTPTSSPPKYRHPGKAMNCRMNGRMSGTRRKRRRP